MQKGSKHTAKTRNIMSKARTGKYCGKNHPLWKGRIMRSGYWYIHIPNHPNSGKQGYVAEHRLVMEKVIGRPLVAREVVHHINHIKTDNRIENLKLFSSRGQHTLAEHPDAFKSAGIANRGKRRSVATEFKKNQTPWNKGKIFSVEKKCIWAECERSANYRDGGKRGYCSKHIQSIRRGNITL